MAQPLPKHRSREYETILILNPDANEALEQVSGRLTDVISRLEGKLLRAENWGKRKLAYPVSKNLKGVYLYLRYLGYSDLVHEMERNMRMLEPVIKYITVKIEEDIDPDARPVRAEDISFLPQFETDEGDRADKRPAPSASTPAKAPEAEVVAKEEPQSAEASVEKVPEKQDIETVSKTSAEEKTDIAPKDVETKTEEPTKAEE